MFPLKIIKSQSGIYSFCTVQLFPLWKTAILYQYWSIFLSSLYRGLAGVLQFLQAPFSLFMVYGLPAFVRGPVWQRRFLFSRRILSAVSMISRCLCMNSGLWSFSRFSSAFIMSARSFSVIRSPPIYATVKRRLAPALQYWL